MLNKGYFRKTIIVLCYLLLIIGYVRIIHRMMFRDTTGSIPSLQEMQRLQTIGSALLICCILLTFILYYFVLLKSSIPEFIKNASLSIVVLVVCFFCGEFYFLHYAASNAIGDRWSYKLWDRQYMITRTSFNYTNYKGVKSQAFFRESPFGKTTKKKKIWFIGDSFTYGFGIENTENTFPAVVEQQLNGKFVSVNLGDGGAAPFQEKDILLTYDSLSGETPALVVWQYFGNDIDVLDLGPDLYAKYRTTSAITQFGQRFFREKSFLMDYLYWEYFTDNEQGAINTYISFLNKLYAKDSAGNKSAHNTIKRDTPFYRHLTPIKEVAQFYRHKGVKFLLVVFPFLWEGGPENAEQVYTHRVVSELKADSIDVIDLTPILQPLPVKKRIVNIHDPHPSILVAKMVGDTIARYVQSASGM